MMLGHAQPLSFPYVCGLGLLAPSIHKQIRPIRLIRGKTEEPILWRTALQAEV